MAQFSFHGHFHRGIFLVAAGSHKGSPRASRPAAGTGLARSPVRAWTGGPLHPPGDDDVPFSHPRRTRRGDLHPASRPTWQENEGPAGQGGLALPLRTWGSTSARGRQNTCIRSMLHCCKPQRRLNNSYLLKERRLVTTVTTARIPKWSRGGSM